ncbi:hypothetical protein COV53_00380 [Candidatus Gottesmanbacteria bacterium CG11_big_fil_rev_8_21_14_0_20_37_11]|uniref:FCP1 homology domain-containing protein n=2 Tax=Candidatus Gottesmaniibacteriota TaxID=1752720 RepID=A0A2M7RT57_9BACT|nr:MAG: hypothetical protein COX23_01060 [Candidatus Gottesmanbacteria bacterium CG23_combo_of_CG06-09_8_20_14_all_37_19]PIR08931.1 MAG: hypothetical protein COV53_00380 [Candidatus Gottesmanbacteria bacterium CG11_big_fil_rev_8_21_14_0_20_37_11]PIZ03275.1 MAG: hypothetical protein COY59_00410 [Candidatus Gottesmanbacteria bacterium CG_4_10_14_0_8_um_filter_37_24]
MKGKIKVGFDFDGVVAYNPFRVVRPIIAFIKHDILGIKKLRFWYPQKKWQQIFWVIVHESSIYPACGIELLKKMVTDQQIEAHLITARYSFLNNRLHNWLNKYKLSGYFKTINLNINDDQPHLFKSELIDKYRLNYYIEDNWDIVNYLANCKKQKKTDFNTKIFWIYNVSDRNIKFPSKFPYLQKALEELSKQIKNRRDSTHLTQVCPYRVNNQISGNS